MTSLILWSVFFAGLVSCSTRTAITSYPSASYDAASVMVISDARPVDGRFPINTPGDVTLGSGGSKNDSGILSSGGSSTDVSVVATGGMVASGGTIASGRVDAAATSVDVSASQPAWWSTQYSFAWFLGPRIWTTLKNTIAVDQKGRIFLTDANSVFVVEDGTPSIYLNQDELLSAVGNVDGGIYTANLHNLTVDRNGNLYIFMAKLRATTGPNEVSYHMLVSPGRGVVKVYRDLAEDWHLLTSGVSTRIGAVSDQEILVVGKGLWAVSPTVEKRIYGASSANWETTGCVGQSFAVERNGFFYYTPGCALSPLVGGRDDGSGVGMLADSEDLGEYYFWEFTGLGIHPEGGVVANFTGTLYGFDYTGRRRELSLTPTMAKASETHESDPGSAFKGGQIGVGPTGIIYLISSKNIYAATPIAGSQ